MDVSTVPSFRLWLLAFVGFFLLHAGWAFATPYNGPPDEQEHTLRAAGIMHGELIGDPVLFGKRLGFGGMHTGPASLQRGWCFPTKVNVAADCEPEPGGDQTARSHHTRASWYNPIYYGVTGWPLGLWPNWTGILLTRLLTGAAVAALLACALVVAVRWTRHRALVAGLVVAVTPTLASLGGAINPNGVEIAAGVALFTALIAVVHEQREGVNRAAVALAGVSAGVLVTPRFTGVLWLLVILGVILVPSSRDRLAVLARSRPVRFWAAVAGVCTLLSVAWTIFAAPDSDFMATPTTHFSLTEVLRYAVLDHMWPDVANQMVAVPGWSELAMPRLVYLVWFATLGMLFLGGLVLGHRVDRWRLLALLFACFTPLLALEILTVNYVGWFNQGRYFLSAAVGLPLLGAYILAHRSFTAEQIRTTTRLLATLLLPIHFFCLAYSMTRWNSGLRSLNPFNGSWSPPLGTALPLAMAAVAIAVMFLVYWRASRIPTPQPAPAESSGHSTQREPVSHV
ncbi:DUF2142 domain-containing protein [Actinophytocola sp.]|uniref:DUF2142 domain-containing protein n=1 Tax=Actinophytocola sp. TaxID=1872138 RepID=UPI002D7F4F10|nr:DUF2142 domain-containing protein [Actinophytocola sp.]HET9138837.1 DUF2142 domain-containing protein [Actinophytocola sp.]